MLAGIRQLILIYIIGDKSHVFVFGFLLSLCFNLKANIMYEIVFWLFIAFGLAVYVVGVFKKQKEYLKANKDV